MRQNTNIIKANLSSDCVVSNAYLLFFANSNSLFVINEYIANILNNLKNIHLNIL